MNKTYRFLIEKAYLISLLAVISFTFCVRILFLSDNPPGFFADEASIGVNAYTILKYGTDEYGTPFPVFFQAFGEYKGPIQIYATVPFIAIFSLSEFSTRLPAVVLGTLTVLSLFFLVKELTKYLPHTTLIAVFSAFFLAISPWHIHISRIAFEQNPYLLFTILGLLFLLKARSHIHYLAASSVFFILGIYSYFPARIFIPAFVIGLFIIFFKSFYLHRKQLLLVFILSFFLLLPVFDAMINGEGFSRWNQVNIFSESENISTAGIHILKNYVSHFSLDFLFLKGDIGMPGQFITRHSVEGIGELYLFQLPLLFFAFIYILHKREFAILSVLILWLLLYPTGSMFTTDESAQATRSVVGVIPFQILTAIGLVGSATLLKRHHLIASLVLLGTVLIISLVSVVHYVSLFFTRYPTYAADFWGWQYGARSIVSIFEEKKDEYDMLVMAPEFNAPYIFFRFYTPEGCLNCTVGLPDTHYINGQKQLFAITPEYLRTHDYTFNTKHVVFYPNNTVAFLIGEIVE